MSDPIASVYRAAAWFFLGKAVHGLMVYFRFYDDMGLECPVVDLSLVLVVSFLAWVEGRKVD